MFAADSGVVVFAYRTSRRLISSSIFSLLVGHAGSEDVETLANSDVAVRRLAYDFFVRLLRSGSAIAIIGQGRRRRGTSFGGSVTAANWSRMAIDLKKAHNRIIIL